MTNHEKRKTIIPWIDPEERVTVHFLDEKDLNAEVTGTTEELVDLSIETHHLLMNLCWNRRSSDARHEWKVSEPSMPTIAGDVRVTNQHILLAGGVT